MLRLSVRLWSEKGDGHMKLNQINERTWVTSFEEERDRPALGYIRGDRYSLAIDAGHSKEHVEEFYSLLKEAELPLPELTVLTHWHWDHTFGMFAINGLSLAEKKTEDHLQRLLKDWDDEAEKRLKAMDEHIALEYRNQRMHVASSDVIFKDEISLDLGGIEAQCLHTESPHTDDSVLILLPRERILFFGDCISGEYPEWIVDIRRMKLLISKLEDLDFDLAIGGHWEPESKRMLLDRLKEENGL